MRIMPDIPSLLDRLRGRLVVSCQALPCEPLHGPEHMSAMALSAIAGGAGGIRCEGPDDVRAIRSVTDLPVIGLWKAGADGVYITPTLEHALAVADAGADIVALDATARPRPDGRTLSETLRELSLRGIPVMADVATLAEGVAAAAAGARVISGAHLLLHQAAVQVALMTGHEAPVDDMRAALRAAVPAAGL